MFPLFIEILAATPAEFLYDSDLGWIQQLRDEISPRDSVELRALPVLEVGTIFPIFVLHGGAPRIDVKQLSAKLRLG